MRFEKGNNYSSGRPPGVKNKKTELWETFKDYCLNGGLERFEDELNKLKGKEFVSAFANLLEFFKPKLSRLGLTANASDEAITGIDVSIVSTSEEKEFLDWKRNKAGKEIKAKLTPQNGSGTH